MIIICDVYISMSHLPYMSTCMFVYMHVCFHACTGLSGLHVVAKTIHCRHVTAKRNEPEWNEHFEL